jgi:hypothetical protein
MKSWFDSATRIRRHRLPLNLQYLRFSSAAQHKRGLLWALSLLRSDAPLTIESVSFRYSPPKLPTRR